MPESDGDKTRKPLACRWLPLEHQGVDSPPPGRDRQSASGRSRPRAALRPALVLAVLLVLGGAIGPAAGSDVASRPADGVFSFDGRGFGHGRGMSQHGAYGAAISGLNAAQILAFYYPGAAPGTVPDMLRRVLLTGEDNDAVVANVAGLVVRNEASGAVVATGNRADWSQVRVRPDATILRVEALQGGSWVAIMPPISGPVRFEGPAVLSLYHPAGVRSYRGTLSAALSGQASKPLYVINTLRLDDYLQGVVPAEMPPGWHLEALKVQAVAARSYGVQPCPQPRAYPTTALYDVVDTTSCQVYRGMGAETASTNRAVADTSSQVLRHNGSVLRAEFSSANGGWTVAGGASVAKEDPYDDIGARAARSTVHRWTGVPVPAQRLEQAFGTGLLREIRVLARDGRGEWGGRVLTVRLVGDSRTVDVTGDQVRFAAGLRSNWFDLAASPIDSKHAALGGDAGILGPAIGPETALVGGRYRPYRFGNIYWTPGAGAVEVHGAIFDRWGTMRWENGSLGFPVTDELTTPDLAGRYNHFQAGSIYWTARTGAWAVQGSIRDAWRDIGWERSPVGYPMTSEQVTPDGLGRYNDFQTGSIYWSPSSRASSVHGSIRSMWYQLGAQAGPLRYPITHEQVTPDLIGRYNHFQSGSVYWTATTGAHEVRGAIRERWASLGWERSGLGYPTSNEYDVPGGRRSDFQRGSITWDARSGATTLS